MDKQTKTVYASHWMDGYKVVATGATTAEAMKNLLEKIRRIERKYGKGKRP